MKVAVIISATTEWGAVKRLLEPETLVPTPCGESFQAGPENYNAIFYHSGWGKIASAGAMQYVLDHDHPDLVINLGTCGGIEGVVKQGDTILVEGTFVYDILDLMGNSGSSPGYYASVLDLGWLPDPPHPVRRGIIASADSDLPPEKIAMLRAGGAIAADWESAALAWVAHRNAARLLILRVVSDLVGEQGGEAYDNLPLYKARTRKIMRQLIQQLPDWLGAVHPGFKT